MKNMRELKRRGRALRPGLAIQALCGVLAVSLLAAPVWAQAPSGTAPRSAPSGPVDPWMAPQGGAPAGEAAGTLGAPATGESMIQVDVKADSSGVRLDRVLPTGDTTPVCLAPCSRLVPRNNLYIIQGDGVRSTSKFLMPDDQSRVTLNVKAGSSGRQVSGALLLLAGVVVGYAGLLTAEVGTAANTFNDASGSGQRSNEVLTVGGVMILAGVAAAVGGIYLVMTSSTHVQSSTGSTFTREDRPRPRRPAVALTPTGLVF